MLDDQDAFLRKIEEIAERDGRYKSAAYLFIYAALEYLVSRLKQKGAAPPAGRHVTGQELSGAIAEYAREQYGPLARPVLEHWGLRTTLDFGHIVFNLVEEGLMGATEEDSLEDFRDVYDFDDAFDPKRTQRLPDELDLERL